MEPLDCSYHKNTPVPVSKETSRTVRFSQAACRKPNPIMDKTGRRIECETCTVMVTVLLFCSVFGCSGNLTSGWLPLPVIGPTFSNRWIIGSLSPLTACIRKLWSSAGCYFRWEFRVVVKAGAKASPVSCSKMPDESSSVPSDSALSIKQWECFPIWLRFMTWHAVL